MPASCVVAEREEGLPDRVARPRPGDVPPHRRAEGDQVSEVAFLERLRKEESRRDPFQGLRVQQRGRRVDREPERQRSLLHEADFADVARSRLVLHREVGRRESLDGLLVALHRDDLLDDVRAFGARKAHPVQEDRLLGRPALGGPEKRGQRQCPARHRDVQLPDAPRVGERLRARSVIERQARHRLSRRDPRLHENRDGARDLLSLEGREDVDAHEPLPRVQDRLLPEEGAPFGVESGRDDSLRKRHLPGVNRDLVGGRGHLRLALELPVDERDARIGRPRLELHRAGDHEVRHIEREGRLRPGRGPKDEHGGENERAEESLHPWDFGPTILDGSTHRSKSSDDTYPRSMAASFSVFPCRCAVLAISAALS